MLGSLSQLIGSFATMLEFFRRYQRAFFWVIFVFVAISFSFFGTFNAISSMRVNTSTAFTAVDGTTVTQGEVDELAAFISTDAEDKVAMGGIWGPNFLNDGVIRKDFLDTGLALVLAQKFAPILGADLQGKLDREKKYTPYKHPQAPFLGANSVWNYFAPDINAHLSLLQQQSDATSQEAMEARINLYLAEKKFPEPMLKQILMYQQKQYGWLKPDDSIVRSDLSLFGYHSVSDWFGQRFSKLIAEFIINSAIQAKGLGYSVSREEALADLLRNSAASYQQLADYPQIGVSNGADYFKQQLQRMNMDQNQAARIWQQVLLFRRLYGHAGNLPLVGQLAFDRFGAFAGEGVEGVLYALPKSLQINNFHMLQALETYLKAVARKPSDPLALPATYYSVNEVRDRNPELVQKRYILNIASVDKKSLQGRVSVSEMWNWQLTDAGWEKLKNEFPELAAGKNNKPENRQAILDNLDKQLRAKVDFYARRMIVDEHPDWLADALAKAPAEKEEVAISYRGGSTPFVDLKDNASLIQLLDAAPVGEEALYSEKADEIAAHARLQRFSADDQHYYRIEVVEKPKQAEIIPFKEAYARGLIDPLLDASLKGYYTSIRDKNPERYKRSDGNWKTFDEVQNDIAAEYFAILLKNIRDDAVSSGLVPKDAPPLSNDRLASLRFYKYVRTLRNEAEKNPEAPSQFVMTGQEEEVEELKWKPAEDLADQWKLEKAPFRESRSSTNPSVNLLEAFEIPLEGWSKVSVPVNGALAFFQVEKKGLAADESPLFDKTLALHTALGNESKQKLAGSLIDEMVRNNAISLEFLDGSQDGSESMEVPGTLQQE